MLKYLNGVIKRSGNKAVLKILLSEDKGQTLTDIIQDILEEYKKYVDGLELIGETSEIHELNHVFRMAKKANLKTCWEIPNADNPNKYLSMEIDYLRAGDRLMRRKKSPDGDLEMWVDV